MTNQYELKGSATKLPKKHDKRDSVLPNGELEGVYESVKDTGSITSDKSSVKSEKPEKPKKVPMVGVLEVFRFSDCKDRMLMVVGTICACAIGAAGPLMMIVFGSMSDIFIDNAYYENVLNAIKDNITATCDASNIPCPLLNVTTLDDLLGLLRTLNMTEIADTIEENTGNAFTSQIQEYSLIYTYMGCAILVVGYLMMMCWHTAAYNQSERIRIQFLRAILRQDISWFDTHDAGELNTRLSDDVDKIEKGIGDKLGLFFQYVAAFPAGFVVGFVYGWKLTLVIVSISPLLAISAAFMSKIISSMTEKELDAYSKAGAVAEEVLGAFRTVVAFGGQEKEVKRYTANLTDAQNFGRRKGIVSGVGMAAVFLIIFCAYALAFWYGSTLVREEDYTAGDMMIVFFSVLMGAFSLGAAGPNIQDFANARGAAYTIYGIIDLIPEIDSSSTEGVKPEKIAGNIEFKNVVFQYPARPEVPVLTGLSLKVNVGQTVALVGSSGCGKSTSVQLIQRFYDMCSGELYIDGIDVKDFNVKWLRQHIGVVSQEPVLFGTTIAENIRYGREDATDEEITKAAKEANAHDFISTLPQKYETLVGERGAQLSGGQKQRIAIARALVRDPKILLLDEATSALDTESEATVQSALDRARLGRTTIVIAHRLSTIQTADIIAGVTDGVIVEQGTHEELMKKAGVYYNLVTSQRMMNEDDDDELDDSKANLKQLTRTFSNPKEKEALHRMRSISIKSSDEKEIFAEKEEKLPDPSIMRVMKLNSPEWLYIVIGCISAVVMGLIQPAFALLFSEIIGVFSNPDPVEQEEKCNFYSAMFVVIGVIAAISNLGMGIMFAISGENLTTRLRELTFRALLRQEIAYFDDHKNSTGALCSRMATDASAVKGATGSRLAALIQSFASIGGGLVIGFVYSWQLTLVVLAFAPFMLISGFIEMRIFAGAQGEKNKKMEEAAKIATEAITNMRTVAALTKEDKFHSIYCKLIAVPYATNRRKAHIIGGAYAFSQSIIMFANAACFSFGGYLVAEELLDYTSMFKVFTAIIFGAMAAGQASSFAPDYGKAKQAAARLFALHDREPSIDSSCEDGEKPEISGSVELRDVKFTYPTRPDIEILKGIDLTISPGQVVALVGSSGCGKSTIVQLVERFYDPSNGVVLIDNNPITGLHLQWVRSKIGIVSQEPVLFDCSIRENIAYGDNFRDVTMEEVIAAARQANIHNFIDALPQGYDTNVGDKGTQLSGGQKQRVAIARALVRSPKILLLDEATSALDTESEKIVQEALERAQQGRTSIVIAHRLSTIQNADCIVVIHRGRVVETGKHAELLAKKGFYFKLNTKQSAHNSTNE